MIDNVETIFFAILIVPILVVVLLLVVNNIYQTVAGVPWQDAPGVIEESTRQIDIDGDHFLTLRYKFFVDDQPYWGDQRISLMGERSASNWLDRLAIGSKVVVSFHPEDPENQSRLDPDFLDI